MDTRRLVLIVVGALMIIVGFTADMIGLGAEPPIFGWKQITLIASGGVVVVIGFVVRRKSAGDTKESSADNN